MVSVAPVQLSPTRYPMERKINAKAKLPMRSKSMKCGADTFVYPERKLTMVPKAPIRREMNIDKLVLRPKNLSKFTKKEYFSAYLSRKILCPKWRKNKYCPVSPIELLTAAVTIARWKLKYCPESDPTATSMTLTGSGNISPARNATRKIIV